VLTPRTPTLDCPPLVSRLSLLYEDVNADSKQLEVIYVSSDHDEASMKEYMAKKHGEWLALAYGDALRNELKRKFGTCAGSEAGSLGIEARKRGIPSFIVVKPDGTVVKEDAAEDVMGYDGSGELPWAA
jgi:nucleoredoxin